MRLPRLHIAPFFYSHIVLARLLCHFIIITPCPSWLYGSFLNLLWSRCGGEMQGTFGWLNMFVCKTGRQKSAMVWWIAVTKTVSPPWPPPAVCPVTSPDTTIALWKTLAHYPSLSLPAVFLTSPARCQTSIPQPSSTYPHLTVTISISLLVPPFLKMTKGTVLHHHFPLLLDPTSHVFSTPQTPDHNPPPVKMDARAASASGGTAIWPCDEWR